MGKVAAPNALHDALGILVFTPLLQRHLGRFRIPRQALLEILLVYEKARETSIEVEN